MATHKAVHVAVRRRSADPRRRRDHLAATGSRPHRRRRVRGVRNRSRLRQRRLPRADVAPHPGPRDRGHHRRDRRRRRGLRGRRPGRGRLVRRQLQPVHPLSQGLLHAVRAAAGAELAVPGWLRRVGHRARDGAGPHPRRAVVRRGRTAGLRRRDDVQRAAQHPGQGRRPRRGARHRRARPPRRAVSRGRWASRPSRSPAVRPRPTDAGNSAPTTTSTRTHPTSRPSSQKLGGAVVVLATAANSRGDGGDRRRARPAG